MLPPATTTKTGLAREDSARATFDRRWRLPIHASDRRRSRRVMPGVRPRDATRSYSSSHGDAADDDDDDDDDDVVVDVRWRVAGSGEKATPPVPPPPPPPPPDDDDDDDDDIGGCGCAQPAIDTPTR